MKGAVKAEGMADRLQRLQGLAEHIIAFNAPPRQT